MVLAIVPAAPPTRKNQRATSCPAPISANVPYLPGSRLMWSAFWSVSGTSRLISNALFMKFPFSQRRFHRARIGQLCRHFHFAHWTRAGRRRRQALRLRCAHGVLHNLGQPGERLHRRRAVAHASRREQVGTISHVSLVLFTPTDELTILILRFHYS